MLRRDFLRLAIVGTCSAAGVAHAGPAQELHAVAVAHAAIGAHDEGAPALHLDVSAHELRDAEITRVEVDADAYFARFGLTPRAVGITGSNRRVTLLTTPFPDALAEIVDDGDRLVLIWDGVAYHLGLGLAA